MSMLRVVRDDGLEAVERRAAMRRHPSWRMQRPRHASSKLPGFMERVISWGDETASDESLLDEVMGGGDVA